MEKKEEYKDYGSPLYVVLEHAGLEVAQMKRGIELLNSEDHWKFIESKLAQNIEDFRPDIVH